MLKEYATSHLRNIAIVGHGKSGKTSLTEAVLLNVGATSRMGRPEDGTTVSDFEPEEIKRKLSISAAVISCEWEAHKLNFIDTPGYPDFVAETQSAMRAADSVLLVVSAPSGIEIETEKSWQYAQEQGLPRAIFINKMDREHVDFAAVVEELRVTFGSGVVPIQVPIGSAETFQGVVDLLSMHTKVHLREEALVEGEIPEFMAELVEEARQKLIEVVAEYDSTLLDKYLEGEEITEAEVAAALVEGINDAKIFPVLCGSAVKNIGARKLLNSLVEYMPAPCLEPAVGEGKDGEIVERAADAPFSAFVFKTTVDPFVGRMNYLKILSGALSGDFLAYNPAKDKNERLSNLYVMRGKKQIPVKTAQAGDILVATKLQETGTGDTLCDRKQPIAYEAPAYAEPMLMMAIRAKKKGEEDKLGSVLARITEEDPTIRVRKDAETKEVLVYGIGELHLDVLVERMQRKYGVEAALEEPTVPFRETIRAKAKAENKYKKQSGGHGQYGHVLLEIEPREAGSGNAFTETIFGGAVPRQYVPAVEKGVTEALSGGVLAGCPIVDVKVNLYDGSYHNVDSSELAFKIAAINAVRKGVMDAHPVLLEPIYNLEIMVPDYYMGDIIGGLNARRARIMGTDISGKGLGVIKAQAPLAELYKYATALRSASQGRGSFTMAFSHYEEMPQRFAEQVIAAKK